MRQHIISDKKQLVLFYLRILGNHIFSVLLEVTYIFAKTNRKYKIHGTSQYQRKLFKL